MVIALTSEKGGVGKSTLAINLSGALGSTLLIDADPIETCLTWASLSSPPPFRVVSGHEVTGADRAAVDHTVIDTEGRPEFKDIIKLAQTVDLVIIPSGTSGVELMTTLKLFKKLKESKVSFENIRVVITRVHPTGSTGQTARDALRERGIPAFESVIRSYSAYQRALEQGLLVRDVTDPRAIQAWSDIEGLTKEILTNGKA